MNRKWLGDSFDIVKRFFIENLRTIGYHVIVDPMFTDEWNWKEEEKENFFRFLGASPSAELQPKTERTALFLDPDTGVGSKEGKRHVTIEIIAAHLKNYEIVLSFDQSFSYGGNASKRMSEKLRLLKDTGNFAFYYDSHARFMFAANSTEELSKIERQLVSAGLIASRLVKL